MRVGARLCLLTLSVHRCSCSNRIFSPTLLLTNTLLMFLRCCVCNTLFVTRSTLSCGMMIPWGRLIRSSASVGQRISTTAVALTFAKPQRQTHRRGCPRIGVPCLVLGSVLALLEIYTAPPKKCFFSHMKSHFRRYTLYRFVCYSCILSILTSSVSRGSRG